MADSVLVTAHDLPLAGKLRTGFRRCGYRVELLAKGEDPAAAVKAAGPGAAEPVLLVVTGGMDAEQGREAARRGREMHLPVLAVGGKGPDALPSPADPDEIVLVGRRTVERGRLRKATGIVGDTDAMMEVLERVIQIAPVDVTVLVTGESGTGKELIARGLHALSRRRHKAFIAVNMAALSETLLESELFGHEKGAFTGAVDARRGFFELAAGGTIFLDEIGEMPLRTQTKLLRVLEQQEFLRVGGEKPVKVNVRIVAATNQRLHERVATGDFRRDLYHRLNVLHIDLPPLRARRADIPLLVDAFIADASRRHDRGPFKGISPDAMRILARHSWPGNVRELRNLVESMVVLAPGRRIRAQDIPAEVRTGDASISSALVPAPVSAVDADGPASVRPQLEFVFRTMMEMKVDIDDLKRDFEAYRLASGRDPSSGASLPAPGEIVYDRRTEVAHDPVPLEVASEHGEEVDAGAEDADAELDASPSAEGADRWHSVEVDTELDAGKDADAELDADAGPSAEADPGPDPEAEMPPRTVVFEPGLTLEEMERRAVRAALAEVDGNRRLAAELLGVAERTLYRKVRQLGLEDADET